LNFTTRPLHSTEHTHTHAHTHYPIPFNYICVVGTYVQYISNNIRHVKRDRIISCSLGFDVISFFLSGYIHLFSIVTRVIFQGKTEHKRKIIIKMLIKN